MKIRKYLAHIAAVIVVAFGTTQVFAALADVDNYGAKGNALSQTESYVDASTSVGDHVVYYFVLTHTATDSTNNVASQAIDLTGLELESIHLYSTATGTRDVNILLQGSNTKDATYFVNSPFTVTTAMLRSASTTTADVLNGDIDDFYADGSGSPVVFDPKIYYESLTSGAGDSTTVIVEDPIAKMRYFRVVSDGQTGNTVSQTGATANSTNVIIMCRKIPGFSRSNWDLVNTN
jgi:hypothetical protein